MLGQEQGAHMGILIWIMQKGAREGGKKNRRKETTKHFQVMQGEEKLLEKVTVDKTEMDKWIQVKINGI